MQGTGDSNQESKSSESETHASKKRRVGERVVVSVKIEDNDKRQQRNEGPPFDCWSWRKYGQKPIKGSPYPRGYYRCSTSKGCSAKKQVERCKTNSSMLIVTYTSTHNHPGPGKSPNRNKQEQDKINSPKQKQEESESELVVPRVVGDSEGGHLGKSPNRSPQSNLENKQENAGIDAASSPKQEQEESESAVLLVAGDSERHFQQRPQSPFDSAPGECTLFESNLQTLGASHGEDPKSVPNDDDDVREFSSLLKSEENDFFDELEELPTTSFFTSLMKRSFCEDRVILNPS